MTDEKRILAEGTVMAARCGTLESATDFILQHDKTVERFSKIEVLEEVRWRVITSCDPSMVLDEMITELMGID